MQANPVCVGICFEQVFADSIVSLEEYKMIANMTNRTEIMTN